jgi:hypothetical protein
VSTPRDQWKRVLRPTGDCIAIERLGGTLTAAEQDHIASCARCQSEMKLWKSFNDETTTLRESEDVRWIAAQIAQPRTSRKFALRPLMFAAAATILIVAGLGYVIENRPPSIDVPAVHDTAYRSSAMNVITPGGDVATAPARVAWTPVPGATIYDVQILEVDRTVLWRASTGETGVDVPAAIRAQFVPGKTILWEVRARRDAAVMAGSGTQKFRVAVR